MGSGDLGQRARLETAEICSRGQRERRRGRFNSRGPRLLPVAQREVEFGAACRSERERKPTEVKREKGVEMNHTNVHLLWILHLLV